MRIELVDGVVFEDSVVVLLTVSDIEKKVWKGIKRLALRKHGRDYVWQSDDHRGDDVILVITCYASSCNCGPPYVVVDGRIEEKIPVDKSKEMFKKLMSDPDFKRLIEALQRLLRER